MKRTSKSINLIEHNFSTGINRKRFITEEIMKIGKGNISADTFTFRELATATKNFNNKNLIGEGGFGRVYKGLIAETNQVLLLLYDVKCLLLFLTSKPKNKSSDAVFISI